MCQRFPEELDDILGADDEEEQDTGAHFTCFTGAKVQILTHLPQETAVPPVAAVSQPRSQSRFELQYQ